MATVEEMSDELKRALDEEKKRHESAIASIVARHKRKVDEISNKECTACGKGSKKSTDDEIPKTSTTGTDVEDESDEDDDDEWKICPCCNMHVCKECAQTCEECDESYCDSCAEHGKDIVGTDREVQICEDCSNGDRFVCCNHVSEVPCGQRVCDECENNNHTGYECNSCYQAHTYGD